MDLAWWERNFQREEGGQEGLLCQGTNWRAELVLGFRAVSGQTSLVSTEGPPEGPTSGKQAKV